MCIIARNDDKNVNNISMSSVTYTFHSRERTKSLEEELHKVKAARSVDDLQRKELEDQLEAEQYFTTLYKTQVRELTDEVDEAKERQQELEREKEILVNEFKGLAARADNEAMAKRVAEEDIAELEKEKMMVCKTTKGASIKDVHTFLVIFDPPPPCLQSTLSTTPLKRTYTFD